MLIEQILTIVSIESPRLVLALEIFIFFWMGGTIFKVIVRRIMDDKSPHTNISKVLASIEKI